MNSQEQRLLLSQVGNVLADFPVFLTSPIYRRWHLRWGATPDEVLAGMPGDDRFPDAQFRATRAITIAAPPELVWPWLVQIGCTRAGWYSNDLLDNLGHPSATTIEAAWQDLHVGQWVPMSPKPPPTEQTAFRVQSFEVNRWLLWTKLDSTWSWRLTATIDGGTRLVNRIHAVHDWHHPFSASLSVALMEFGDFAMNRRMLRGIQARAECLALHAEGRPPPNPCGSVLIRGGDRGLFSRLSGRKRVPTQGPSRRDRPIRTGSGASPGVP